MDTETRESVAVAVASIRRALLRGRVSTTLAEAVEWEREFGDEMTAEIPGRLALPRDRITFCRQLARRYGVSYVTVRDAFVTIWV
jgi:hypothetical protein